MVLPPGDPLNPHPSHPIPQGLEINPVLLQKPKLDDEQASLDYRGVEAVVEVAAEVVAVVVAVGAVVGVAAVVTGRA